jgi:hypothetical protein
VPSWWNGVEREFERILLRRIVPQLNRIEWKQNFIMTQVAVAQEDLDAIATDLTSVGNALSSEIADLEAKIAANQPLSAGDLTGLKAAQAKLDELAVPSSAPVETPPADVPPVDGSGDTTVPPDGTVPSA